MSKVASRRCCCMLVHHAVAPGPAVPTHRPHRKEEIRGVRTKREAEQAANDAEAKVRARTHRDPTACRIRFDDYVNRLVRRTGSRVVDDGELPVVHRVPPTTRVRGMRRCRHPPCRRERLGEAGTVRRLRGASIRNWRALPHLILEDAHEEGLVPANPVARRRGRDRRAGRSRYRGPGEEGDHGSRDHPYRRARCSAVRS